MLNTLSLFLCLLVIPCTSAWSNIIRVEQLDSIKELLSDANEQDLIIFDVDSTLIIPEDMVLRPCGDNFLKTALTNTAAILSPERTQNLTSLVLFQRPIHLVDQGLPPFIRELQNRPCKVVALTAMLTGRFGQISSMEDWRYNELKNFGIDFSEAFPFYNHIVFGDIKKEDFLPIFKNGILCSAKSTKGETLEAFLHRVKWKPKRVFFIDDQLVFLESVQTHMNQADIEFIGIHYRAVDTFNDVFNQDIALLQLEHLIKKEEWLTDAQIKQKQSSERP